MTKYRIGLILVCLVALTCLFEVGCGPKGPKMAGVTGALSWQGKPVTTGVVTLYSSATGQGASAEVGADGTFKFAQVVVGSYQVSIEAPLPRIPGEGEPPKPVAPFPIPARYQQNQTSGLTFDVKADTDNVLTLDLK